MVNNKELKEIFNGIKNNDEKVFKKLYEKYNKLIYGVAFSICKNNDDSEDVVQNVFSKIYVLDKDKLPVNNEATWLYTVTKNETITLLKKKHNMINIEELYELPNDSNDIENIIDKNTFKKLISGLNEKEKEIMSLKILADLSFNEIGEIINEPVGTVKWRYYKSVNSLKICLSSLTMSLVAFIFGARLLKKDMVLDKQAPSTEDNVNIKNEDTETKNTLDESKNLDFEYSSIVDSEAVTSNVATNVNYNAVCLFSIASVFLVITIIFAIFCKKYQLKLKKKSSK